MELHSSVRSCLGSQTAHPLATLTGLWGQQIKIHDFAKYAFQIKKYMFSVNIFHAIFRAHTMKAWLIWKDSERNSIWKSCSCGCHQHDFAGASPVGSEIEDAEHPQPRGGFRHTAPFPWRPAPAPCSLDRGAQTACSITFQEKQTHR